MALQSPPTPTPPTPPTHPPTNLPIRLVPTPFMCRPQDNYPALQLTVSDLSPFYLAEARSNMEVRAGGARGQGCLRIL